MVCPFCKMEVAGFYPIIEIGDYIPGAQFNPAFLLVLKHCNSKSQRSSRVEQAICNRHILVRFRTLASSQCNLMVECLFSKQDVRVRFLSLAIYFLK